MRPIVERLLKLDWSKEGLFYNEHVQSIVDMQLTQSERHELCDILRNSVDCDLIGTVTGVMKADACPEYDAALKDALDRDDTQIVKYAAMALIAKRSAGYLQLLFKSSKAQEALGDDIAFELSGRGSEFTDEMRSKFLQMFCERFDKDTPRLDAMTAPWFRMLAELGETNDEIARILVRIWHELKPSDSHNRYLVLLAMSARPHLSYEPILRAAAKSKVGDLRELGQDGLHKLGE